MSLVTYYIGICDEVMVRIPRITIRSTNMQEGTGWSLQRKSELRVIMVGTQVSHGL